MDAMQCAVCGNPVMIAEKPSEQDGVFHGWADVALKDGNTVCKGCAEKTRIMFPLRSTKTFAVSSARFGSGSFNGKTIDGKGWINALVDPMEQLTLDDFRQAMQDAEHAAEVQAARFPGARAAAEADFTYRHYIKSGGSGVNTKYSDEKQYFTCVKVLYGEIRPGDTVCITHKDREYTAEVSEVWFWNYLDTAHCAIEKAFAGVTAALLFCTEVPFIYPGDILTVKES